jgi:hypothetical protein
MLTRSNAVAVDANHPPLPSSTSALRVDEEIVSNVILIFPHGPSVVET